MNHKFLSYFLAFALLFFVFNSCSKPKTESADQEQNSVQLKSLTRSESDFTKIEFQFTAYKTMEKVGVNGTFNELYLEANNGETIPEIMEGAKFTINPTSVNTGLTERDMKITKYFFANLKTPAITGKFQSFSDKGYEILIKMNNIEKVYNVPNAASSDSLSFDFPIDVIDDFSASESLSGIAKACEVLHQSKTWSEVRVKGVVVK